MPLRNLLIILSLLVLSACSSVNSTTPLSANASQDGNASYALQPSEPEDTLSENELALLPEPVDIDVWQRIRNGYSLDHDINRRVRQQLDWYAKHPEYINRVAKRGERYLYHIVEEIEKRDMPMELALLPIVESAFDPFAYSHGRASGMWQFIPGTGKMMGLKQDWWYDGRRDVVASTDAALRYLQSLNKRFDGDWMHALASYNSGSGNVSKAMRKNRKRGKETDFWNLDLPRETEAYVPKLIALAILIKDPEVYGLDLYSVPNEPYFTVVDTGGQIDLAQAAKLADIDMDALYALNPAYNRWATDPDGPHRLLVPVDKAVNFKHNLAQLPPEQRVTWQRYTIREGDNLSTIATDHNISVSSLKSINNIRGTFIRAGKILMVPVATADTAHYSQSADQRLSQRRSQSAKTAKGNRVDHKVAQGESLWSIAQRYKVSTKKIARWNNMAPKDPIHPGQSLAIWTSTAQTQANAVDTSKPVIRKVSYKVRKGDSLHRIADKFQLGVNDILRWNQINTSKYLQPGQSLTLFVDVTKSR
ncbi:membrane-bound lytic murein transglycosylase D [Alteromonadaceae bacterium Bs31]|nr:membrane-bound lytic murein transglycosylase D [Alteromonadaceae bacterium Bs31]